MRQENIEKILLTGYKLITMETTSPEQSLEDFRPLVREGKAIYVWKEGVGLSRVEACHITIPNTKTPEMVLNHINKSKLFGIFLLVGFHADLAKIPLISTIEQIANNPKKNKTIIFIDHYFDYPYKLMDKLLITQEPNLPTLTQIKK